jgi:thiamine-monophosphate kinase
VDEFELIQKFFVRPDEAASVIIGIGDDGAVLRPPMGKDLVTVVDTLVEGIHFPSNIKDTEAESLGYRAVAVNLSDIAAMGAEPRWMTLALTLSEVNDSWLSFFANGLHDAAKQHGVALVGGDVTSGENVVVTVQITGHIDPGRAICRSGARVGDTIYVSGDVGDAAAGLFLLQNRPETHLEPHGHLYDRYWFPTARVALGSSLLGRASAAIDVSDGLYADLGKLLTASGVGAKLDLDKLPISTALTTCFDKEQQRKFALSGGDDYELCFTSANEIPGEIAGVPVTAIGEVTAKSGIVCHEADRIVPYQDSGYLHFQ